MTAEQDPDLQSLHVVTANLIDSVASIEADEWGSATPCSDWNLGALVDHVTGGNWFTVMVVTGTRAEEAMNDTMARFGGTSATSEAAIQSLKDQEDAFKDAQVLDRVWNHSLAT